MALRDGCSSWASSGGCCDGSNAGAGACAWVGMERVEPEAAGEAAAGGLLGQALEGMRSKRGASRASRASGTEAEQHSSWLGAGGGPGSLARGEVG
jgi:hypothetical protein